MFTFGCYNLIPPRVLYGLAEMRNRSVIQLGLHLCRHLKTLRPTDFILDTYIFEIFFAEENMIRREIIVKNNIQ